MSMTPMLFGTADRRLFGVFHSASGRRKRLGAVICTPLGKEYLWAHRACRLLAERLERKGIDVMRFDYFGTGDSAGSGEEVSLNGCIADVLTAIHEVTALAGVRDVALIGLRIGGAIALYASGLIKEVSRVVLWDPISDGPTYLEDLLCLSDAPHSNVDHVAGFPLPKELQFELRRINHHDLSYDARHNLLVVSEDLDQHHTLFEYMRKKVSVEFEIRLNNPVWAEFSNLGVGTVPVNILERIEDWL